MTQPTSQLTTGLAYYPSFLEHDTGPGHPERRERLSRTLRYLEKQAFYPNLIPTPARRAEPEDLLLVHQQDYVKRARETCQAAHPWLDSPDVAVSRDSYRVALDACGAALQLADELMADNINNGFALLRPPGHHAETGMALGFCLFNNVAVLARYLQKQHGLDKIAIVDWDVHHGNGTQHLFEEDPSVLYISTHQFPFYPGTGNYTETGRGRGAGATLNCPLPAGTGDADYQAVFAQQVLPCIDAFHPEIILISAGFDAHRDDPLANLCLSSACFDWMTECLMECATRHAGGRLLSLLEGGYHLQRLPECVSVHLARLAGTPRKEPLT